LDSRGNEVSIANAVNIKQILGAARSVKVIVLVDYSTVKNERATGLAKILQTCSQLFGGVDNFVLHAPSIFIGVNRVPQGQESLDELKEWLEECSEEAMRENPGVMRAFAERLFIFDPLGQLLAEGSWTRDECLAQLAALPALNDPVNVFEVSLDDRERVALNRISREIEIQGRRYAARGDFVLAGAQFSLLERLNIIGSHEVRELLEATIQHIGDSLMNYVNMFRELCYRHDFEGAERILIQMQEAVPQFGERFVKIIDIDAQVNLLAERRRALDEHEKDRKRLNDHISSQGAEIAEIKRQKEAFKAREEEMQRRADQADRNIRALQETIQEQQSALEEGVRTC